MGMILHLREGAVLYVEGDHAIEDRHGRGDDRRILEDR
jgi:hypothetical protein